MKTPEKKEVLEFADGDEWELWLSKHHNTVNGVWLRIGKKNAGTELLTIEDALDGALCYGWIDSIRKSYDESSFLQKYSPRRKKSPWSKINIRKVKVLMKAGRMRPPGLKEVAEAKKEGRWQAAYDSQRNLNIPLEFTTALNKNTKAKYAFNQLNKSEKYAVILPFLKSIDSRRRNTYLKNAIAGLVRNKKKQP